MEYIQLSNLCVSQFILGSNPFSGFSHHDPAMDREMMRYFTIIKIKQILNQAESLGINTLIARVDHHVLRFLLEYWDEGGTLLWFAQTCPEVGDYKTCVSRAISGGAKACHIHGGVMDNLFARNRLEEIPTIIQMIRDKRINTPFLSRFIITSIIITYLCRHNTGNLPCVGIALRV